MMMQSKIKEMIYANLFCSEWASAPQHLKQFEGQVEPPKKAPHLCGNFFII
jgi:hypothetical protein